MLGRLARWLRLLGHDTLYYPCIEDSLILRIAKEQNRTLLTRDTRLVKVRDVKDFLLLKENDPLEQLRTVVTQFKLLSPDEIQKPVSNAIHSRCSLCNNILNDAGREEAKPHVPPYVYMTSRSFKKCPACDKYYWKGTHRKLLLEKLREIVKMNYEL